jgi:hypothetical protein
MKGALVKLVGIAQWSLVRDTTLFITYITFLLGSVAFAVRSDPTSHGEWLVHYGDGFVRRGLPGEIILRSAEFTGIHPSFFILAFQLLGYLALLAVIRQYFLRQPSLSSVMLLFMPGGLLYIFAEPSMAGRKDFLLFLAVVITFQLAVGTSSQTLKAVVSSAAWLFVFFSHEASLAFFPGVLVVTFYLANRTEGLRWRKVWMLAPVLSFIFATLSIGLETREGKFYELCSRALTYSFHPRICDGAMQYINQSSSDLESMVEGVFSREDSWFYVSFFAVAVMALIISSIFAKVDFSTGILTLLLLLVGTVLLALIASDWGRWLHMFTVTSLLSATALATSKRPISQGVLVTLIVLFVFAGYSFNGGNWMSPLGNLLNLNYYLRGGMYG